MISRFKIRVAFSVAALIFAAASIVSADTIKLKDGSVIKGKIVDFKNQQITIVRTSANNRSTELRIDADDIETVEFDSFANLAALLNNSAARVGSNVSGGQTAASPTNDRGSAAANSRDASDAQPSIAQAQSPTAQNQQSNARIGAPSDADQNSVAPQTNGGLSQVINSQPVQPSISRNSKFVSAAVKVLADSTANGWTNTGIVVKKGQLLRISANGRISLGRGQSATPAGLGSIADGERLMKTEPTGALIAVIGDDNNDFVFIGARREFVAQRDGKLYLGVNEGNLDDNSGAFDAVVEAEAPSQTAGR